MSEADLKIITDGLRTDAAMWDEQSAAIGGVAHKVESMRMTRIEAGLFQIIFTAYDSAIDQISARCTEGSSRMSEVADALIKNAKAYDNHEISTEKSVEDAY
ncbi:hypothetical protein ACFRQM_00715 [Streptomyces sp. NPDC056831]|uniref:hypothetical protein n=1 Tax=Streptomyces sp. NPDC056831 TaxID=3345954 RepID=UPI0036B1C9FE